MYEYDDDVDSNHENYYDYEKDMRRIMVVVEPGHWLLLFWDVLESVSCRCVEHLLHLPDDWHEKC